MQEAPTDDGDDGYGGYYEDGSYYEMEEVVEVDSAINGACGFWPNRPELGDCVFVPEPMHCLNQKTVKVGSAFHAFNPK